MTPGQTCSTCKYWITGAQVGQQLLAAGVRNAPTPPGYCAFNPPVKSADNLRWPVTGGTEVCGQWTANG